MTYTIHVCNVHIRSVFLFMSCLFAGCVYDIHDICLCFFLCLMFLLDVYMTYTTYVCIIFGILCMSYTHPDIYRVLAIDSCFFAGYISVLLDIRMQSWQTSRHNKYLDINVTIQVRHTWHVSRLVDTRHVFFFATSILTARITFFASFERFDVYARVFLTYYFENVWTRARILPVLSTV